jgi:hypothetical protein
MYDKSTRLQDIDDATFTPSDAAEIFASPYDDAIQQILGALNKLGYTEEEFSELVEKMKDLMMRTMPIPADLTIETSMPFVQASDLMILGALSAEAYARRDLIEDAIEREREK